MTSARWWNRKSSLPSSYRKFDYQWCTEKNITLETSTPGNKLDTLAWYTELKKILIRGQEWSQYNHNTLSFISKLVQCQTESISLGLQFLQKKKRTGGRQPALLAFWGTSEDTYSILTLQGYWGNGTVLPPICKVKTKKLTSSWVLMVPLFLPVAVFNQRYQPISSHIYKADIVWLCVPTQISSQVVIPTCQGREL